ncbi:MAG: hypothetical protein ACREQ5_07925, partial [Candidatus Dormibacteria bacterium]
MPWPSRRISMRRCQHSELFNLLKAKEKDIMDAATQKEKTTQDEADIRAVIEGASKAHHDK